MYSWSMTIAVTVSLVILVKIALRTRLHVSYPHVYMEVPVRLETSVYFIQFPLLFLHSYPFCPPFLPIPKPCFALYLFMFCCISCYTFNCNCRCICPLPFTGPFCEGVLDAQPCQEVSCLNGGRCFVTGGGMPQCQCLEGSAGSRCEEDTIDDCDVTPEPCVRGFCVDGIRGHSCNCPK